jgi:phage head maturation protease
MLAPLDSTPMRASIDADGTVEGYASLFGEIDQARDMVMPGAFARTLASRGVRRIPMLFQHDPAEPIGIWLELREDFRGLYARGRLIPDVQRAREVLEISIVTFPLLAGARVRAIKEAAAPPRPRLSLARARAEREWRGATGAGLRVESLAPRRMRASP